MTATLTQACNKPQNPMSRDEVKRMLRDAAFVLHLTQRVKAEIVAERPESSRKMGNARPELSAGLGV